MGSRSTIVRPVLRSLGYLHSWPSREPIPSSRPGLARGPMLQTPRPSRGGRSPRSDWAGTAIRRRLPIQIGPRSSPLSRTRNTSPHTRASTVPPRRCCSIILATTIKISRSCSPTRSLRRPRLGRSPPDRQAFAASRASLRLRTRPTTPASTAACTTGVRSVGATPRSLRFILSRSCSSTDRWAESPQ